MRRCLEVFECRVVVSFLNVFYLKNIKIIYFYFLKFIFYTLKKTKK